MSSYREENCCTFRQSDEGEFELLANFNARIVEEIRFVDGITTQSILIIEGCQMEEGVEVALAKIEVSAEQFPGLAWVLPNWGVRCVIRPGMGIKDDMRAAIQLFSKPQRRTVYKHMGWTELAGGERAYLHAKGAIRASGNDPGVAVRLPEEMQLYDLTPSGTDHRAGVKAIIDLGYVAPPGVAWPLVAATLAPLFGQIDFAVHVTGRTGTFKSELLSLFQSLYGTGMDARHLPGSWSSTGNALEAQSFIAANAAFVIDDFIPAGTSWQVRAYQQNADKIIRAQGNQAGRARLNDISSLQRTMYPRGIVLSSGEDTPEGHSVRARMLILELSPGDVPAAGLTRAQANREMLKAGTMAVIQWLAASPQNLNKEAELVRKKLVNVGHARTPSMIGRLIATMGCFLEWAASMNYISKAEWKEYHEAAIPAITEAGNRQARFMEDSDPVDIFLNALRAVLSNGGGHLRTPSGGIPNRASVLGWNAVDDMAEIPLWKSRGPCIGWINWNNNEVLLEVNIGFAAVKKNAGTEFAMTKQTLFRRMKDAGVLSRSDEQRQRNTIRITAEQHPRTVVAMVANVALGSNEVGDNDEDEGLESLEVD